MDELISPACNDASVVTWKTHADCTGTYSATMPHWGPCACPCHGGAMARVAGSPRSPHPLADVVVR